MCPLGKLLPGWFTPLIFVRLLLEVLLVALIGFQGRGM